MLRKLAVLVLISFTVAGWAWAAKPERNVPAEIRILTQNMDDGTDQTYIIAALQGAIPGFDVPTAVDLTFAELQASDFEGRAALMAKKIAADKPHIVALQEAALWRTGPTPATATNVLFDQLGLLLSALEKEGVPYETVAVNRLTDIALSGNAVGVAVRFTDRNAVLVRADLRPPQFHISNVHARTFSTAFPFGGLTVEAGWISVDIHTGNRQFRFVTTHLESPVAGVPEATDVQMAQAAELIRELRNLTIPVVICGDFNSDANGGSGPDATQTYALFETAGYTESWTATHPGDPGLTWPLYLEDQFPAPPFFAPFDPIERIDLFFSKGMDALSTSRVIISGPGDGVTFEKPPFASDHAGVMAVFKP